MTTKKLSLWLSIPLTILIPFLGMAMGVGVVFLLGWNQTDYGNLIINLFFLFGVIVFIAFFRLSAKDLGLKVIKDQMRMHASFSLAIFIFYMLFYILVVRISALKPFSSSTQWGLVTYLIVAIAEEVYFRGASYSFFEKRFSSKTALIVTSILFGLFHAQQGRRGVILKMFTGWLWGSIRYSTGMIFLLIIPVHFAYNSIWLLFEGNWGNPPAWAIYTLPTVEFVFGLAVVFLRSGKLKNI